MYDMKFNQSSNNKDKMKQFSKNTQDDRIWILGNSKVSKLIL
jgi:hypothetical protein